VLAGPYPRDAWDDHFIANWSPDGKTVIFMANQGIWQVNADGSCKDTGSRESTTGSGSQGVAWSSPAGPGGGVENGSGEGP
jgi:hypothetical protein